MNYSEYDYQNDTANHLYPYLLPHIVSFGGDLGPGSRVLDVGCGNGYLSKLFLEKGCKVVGIDLSESGIQVARKRFPEARFETIGADENILENLNEPPFDLVISIEVVEHLYDPRSYAKGCHTALRSGGRFLCSTPYHGYLKNLAISLTNKWDSHANPLWDGGHIKLWSFKSLSRLLHEAGFEDVRFRGVGRLPFLWMTMLMLGIKE